MAIDCLLIMVLRMSLMPKTASPVMYFLRSGESIANVLIAQQESYRKIYAKYATEEDGILDQLILPEGYTLYLDAKKIPRKYIEYIPKEQLPYLSDRNFRFLISITKTDWEDVCFWFVSDNSQPRILKECAKK